MNKTADLAIRIDEDMLRALDAEASATRETRSIVARRILLEGLRARGYLSTAATEGERANVRAASVQRRRKRIDSNGQSGD